MDDLSVYQWLVLGLLSLIALSAVAIAFGFDRSLEAITQRLEAALDDVRREIENLASDMNRPRHIEEYIAEIERDNDP